MTPDQHTKYKEWIALVNLRYHHNPFGKCREESEKMAKQFPELTIVKGHVEDLQWGRRSHIWLKTAEGEIVDPTVAQFPSVMEYEEWEPGDEVRVGKCMECGEEIWRSVQTLDVEDPGCRRPYFCSEECSVAMAKSMG